MLAAGRKMRRRLVVANRQNVRRTCSRRLAELRGVVERMRAAFADVPAAEIEREVAAALAEVRSELRQERAEGHRAG
jgi:hypothetical protein